MSDSSSQGSSLSTTDSPSIHMEHKNNNNNKTIKEQSVDPTDALFHHHHQHNTTNTNSSTSSFLNGEDLKHELHSNHPHPHPPPHHSLINTGNNYDDFLFNATSTNEMNSNMDFLMMGLEQQISSNGANAIHQYGTNMHLESPVLEFQHQLNGNMNITPSLNALTNGLFDGISSTNTPHLPPLNIDANSQPNHGNDNPQNNENNDPHHVVDKMKGNDHDKTETSDIDIDFVHDGDHNNNNMDNNNNDNLMSTIPAIPTMPSSVASLSNMATMPHIDQPPMSHSHPPHHMPVPPPTELDWQTFCKLIEQNNNDPTEITNAMPPLTNIDTNDSTEIDYLLMNGTMNTNTNTNSNGNANNDTNTNTNNSRKRKKMDTMDMDDNYTSTPSIDIRQIEQSMPNKRRRITRITPKKEDEIINININEDKNDKLIHNKKEVIEEKKKEAPKKKKRGRPRKHPEKSPIKKEKKDKKARKKRNQHSDDEIDVDQYLTAQPDAESYVGIRTEDGEVRIQIPPSKTADDDQTHPRVKFSVFGNACSDKIEDILQPKKRTRYVRGLSEEEKKTRRREQNRNAAARSRARKNAMISKVIQLHQENMGLRAFVAENITQTKILRDEINRLNSIIQIQHQHQQHHHHQQPQQHHHPHAIPPHPAHPPPSSSSLFDIMSQDSSTLFPN